MSTQRQFTPGEWRVNWRLSLALGEAHAFPLAEDGQRLAAGWPTLCGVRVCPWFPALPTDARCPGCAAVVQPSAPEQGG